MFWCNYQLDLTEELFRAQQAHERAPELRGREGGKATAWKLFRREERPALERNIIDTPKRTRADYRNVMGQHFGV